MESPFLPSDTSFRYQVTSCTASSSSSKRQTSPARRLRAWEKPSRSVEESSRIYDNVTAVAEQRLDNRTNRNAAASPRMSTASPKSRNRQVMLANTTPVRDTPATDSPNTVNTETSVVLTRAHNDKSTNAVEMEERLRSVSTVVTPNSKWDNLLSHGSAIVSPVSAVYANTAASPDSEVNQDEEEQEEEDLNTPIPCHPQETEDDTPVVVSPRKLEAHFTVSNNNNIETRRRSSHSSLLQDFLGSTNIRMVALVTCMALLLDVTWVRQTATTTSSITEGVTNTYDTVQKQQQQQSSLDNNDDAVLVSMTIEDNLPSVDVERSTKDTPAYNVETDIALLLTESDTIDTIRENQMKLMLTDMDLSTKIVPDINTTSRVAMSEAAPIDLTDLNTSVAPPTEVRPKLSSHSIMSSSLVGTSVALSEDGDIMAIASTSAQQRDSDSYNMSFHGWVRIFSRTKRSQIGKDISLGALDMEDIDSDVTISLSPKGTCMVTGWFGQIRLYQKASDGWLEDVKVHHLFQNQISQEAVISSVAISTDCNTVVVAAGSIHTARKWGSRWSMDSENQSFTTGTSEHSFVRVSLSADASRMVVGHLSLHDDGNTVGSICVWNRYPHSSQWLQLGQPILNMDHQWWSRVGDLVSMSSDGSTVAVGYSPVGKRGVVDIFSFDSDESKWNQMGNTLVGDAGLSFGHALSLSSNGNCLAVRDNEGLVMAYEFEPVSLMWHDLGEAFYSSIPSVDDENVNDYDTGYPKVALSGDCEWIAIGDPTYRNGTGVAHMFQL